MIAAVVIGCAAGPNEENAARASAVAVSARQGEDTGSVARAERAAAAEKARGEEDAAAAREVPPGTGRDEYDSLSIGCERAIASRQEGGRTIVYITPTEKERAKPGQWVHCENEDRPPSTACEVLAIVDGGMLEARCGEVRPGSTRPPT